MTDNHGRRGGRKGPQFAGASGEKVEFTSSMPAAVAESLTREFTDKLRLTFRRANVSPDLIYAFSKTGRIVTEDNRHGLSPAQHQAWIAVLREYRRRAEADSKAIDLCYTLHHESGRSGLSGKKRFAVSELGVAVLNAQEEEISSFAMEGVFLNAWLNLACRCIRVYAEDAEELRKQFGANMTEFRDLLSEIYDDLPSLSWGPVIERRIAQIEAARALPETWLGKPPASNEEAEWEMTPALEHLQAAISFCQNVPQDVMEAMLLRFWLRTLVLNDRMSETFFQVLDRNWDVVHARVQQHLGKYSGPRLQ